MITFHFILSRPEYKCLIVRFNILNRISFSDVRSSVSASIATTLSTEWGCIAKHCATNSQQGNRYNTYMYFCIRNRAMASSAQTISSNSSCKIALFYENLIEKCNKRKFHLFLISEHWTSEQRCLSICNMGKLNEDILWKMTKEDTTNPLSTLSNFEWRQMENVLNIS